MINSDILLRGSFTNCNVRFVLTETTDTVASAIKTHDTDPIASLLFGEALTSTALLSALLTGTEKYALKWEYNGAIGNLVTDVTAENHIRGISKEISLSHVNSESELFGEDGTITLIKSDRGRIINSGTSKGAMLNVTDDIAFYLSTSDQIETEIVTKLSFNPDPSNPVKIATGLMIQALPDCDLEQFGKMRDSLQSDELSKLLLSAINPEKKLQEVLIFLLKQISEEVVEDIREVSSYEFGASPQFKCSCSRLGIIQSLKTIAISELQDLLDSEDGLKITCEFCKTEYIFHKTIEL